MTAPTHKRGGVARPASGDRERPATAAAASFSKTFPAAPRSLRETYSALREEYLKLRALAFNEHTQLPTHHAVLPELRDRLRGAHSLALVVVSVENLAQVEEALGWRAADELLARATHSVRAFATARLPPETVLAQEGMHGEQLLVFMPLAGEDHAAVEKLERLAVDLEVAVASELLAASAETPCARLATGFSLVSDNPFLRFERVVGRAIVAAQSMRQDQAARTRHTRKLQLGRIIETRDIAVVFQPIIDLGEATIFGYEGLCRGPKGTPFEVAEFMFGASHELDLAPELDSLCRESILCCERDIERGRKLFLNVLPESIEQGHVEPKRFLELVAARRLRPSDVVLEIAERSRVADYPRFRKLLRPFREAGCLVALDDIGTGYSSLRLVPELEPDFLKVDMSVVKNIDQNPTQQGVLATIVDLGARLTSKVVCEGIESREELRVVVDAGVDFGQGFFLLHPASQPAGTFVQPPGFVVRSR